MTDNYAGLFSKRVAEVFVTESADGLTNYDYERIQQRAEEDVIMITESINSIASKGGVSRPIMASVQELIPAGRPLNSYTNHVSGTNQKFALESLSLGIKIAIGVGLVAVLGVAIWYMMRAKSHSVPTVKTGRLEAADALADQLTNGASVNALKNMKLVSEELDKVESGEYVSANLRKFFKEGDILTARTALRLEFNDRQLETEELIKEKEWAKRAAPDIFEPYREGSFAREMNLDQSAWDGDYSAMQTTYLKTNYSEERFDHLIAVRDHLRKANDPDFVPRGQMSDEEYGQVVSAAVSAAADATERLAKLQEAATVEAILASTPGCTELTALMLSGKYHSILSGNPSMVQATDDFLAIIDRYVVKVLQKAASGTVRSEEQVDQLIDEMDKGQQWDETAKEYHKSIDQWCKDNKISLAVSKDYSSIRQTFQNLLGQAPDGEFKGKGSSRLSKIVTKEQVVIAKESQDKVTTLLADLEGVKQKVEANGLPERLSTATKKMVDEWKPVMQMVEAIFFVVSQEIAVLNNTGNIKGAAIAKSVKETRGLIKDLKSKLVDPKMRGRGDKAALLLEEINTSDFAEFDKIMSEAQKG